MPVVFVPGKGNIQFPDDMTPYQIQLTIEREIIPNRKPDTISAPKQPEGTIWNAIKGIGAEIAAVPAELRATIQDISAGDIVEGIARLNPLGAPAAGIGKAVDEFLPSFGPSREEMARREAIYGEAATRTREKQAAREARAAANAAAPDFESPLARMGYSAASSLVQMSPGLIGSVATGSPIPALANIGAITFPEAYQRYEERGATPQEALTGATAETGIELGTEMLPLGAVVNKLGKVGFGKFLREFLGRELIGEEIATITQGAVDTAIANPDKTWGEYLDELPMQMVETAGATLLTGGALAGAGAIAKRITGAQEPTEEAPAAKRAAEQAPPPPPPADFAQKLGEVGSKIILNEPGGANEYTYRGMDADGRVIIEAEDGSMFAEDPAEINAAIDVGAVVPTEPTVPGVAFGEPVADEAAALAAKVDAREVDFNARLDAEEAKLNELREEALRLKAEAENKPVSQPAPAPSKPGPMPLPLAKDAKDIIGEYSQGRETSDLQQIFSIASDLARQYGKRSITKDILFKAGQRFDGIPPVEAPQAAAPAPEEKFTVTLPPKADTAEKSRIYNQASRDLDAGLISLDEFRDKTGLSAYDKPAPTPVAPQAAAPAPEEKFTVTLPPAAEAEPVPATEPDDDLQRIMGILDEKDRADLIEQIEKSAAEGRPFYDMASMPWSIREKLHLGPDLRVLGKASSENSQQVIDAARTAPLPVKYSQKDVTDIENVSLPNPSKDWKGGPDAEVSVGLLPNGKWVYRTSSVGPLGGHSSPFEINIQYPTRDRALDKGLLEILSRADYYKDDKPPQAKFKTRVRKWAAQQRAALPVGPATMTPSELQAETDKRKTEREAKAAAPAAPEKAAPRAVGRTVRATIPATREKVDVRYELQDLDNIKFAQDELQNRDRSRPASDAFITDFVKDFDPDGVGEHPETDRGAPVINKDNVILSGNGRTMGLQEIYDFHPDKVEIYKESLREQGYDITGIEQPILVRRLMSDVDERKFVTASNEPDVAALSPPEQAAQDASDILTPGVFSKFNGGDLNAAKNDAFVSAFLGEMSSQQRKNYMDDKGKVSAQAIKRIENALLYKAYGGSGRASKIFVSKAMERSSDDTKTLTNSLIDVSKDWIKFQQAVKDAEVDKKYDITDKLMQVVGTVSDIKTSNTKIADALRSPDLMEEMDPFVRDILLSFHDDNFRILSRKAIAEKLKAFTEVAANQQPEPDMFGKAKTPSARDIWKRVDAGEGAPQIRMFAPPTPANKGTPSKPALPSFWQQMFDDAEKIPSLSLEIKKLTKLHEEGKIDDVDFAREVKDIQWFVSEMRNAKRWRDAGEPRLRGADRIREVILAAKRRGDITEKAANFAEWFALRNPHLLDNLGISVIKDGPGGLAAFYTPFDRIMHLIKGSPSEVSAVHEIMHHLERMMPEPIRKAIKASWAKELDRAEVLRYDGRSRNDDLFFKAVRAFHAEEKVKINGKNLSPVEAFEFANDLVSRGKVDGRLYQYLNPSEFWAVNAAGILKGRYEVQGSLLGRLRNWLRELSTKIKGLFKLDPDAPILKALDSVLKGDGKFVTGRLLEEKLGKFGEGETNVSSLTDERNRRVLDRAEQLERQDMKANANALDEVIDDLNLVYESLPKDSPQRADVDALEERLSSLLSRIENARRPSNENVPETELEKAQREYDSAHNEFMDFFYNPNEERQFMDRRTRARKEYEKELDRLEKIDRETRDRWEKLYQEEMDRISGTMLNGSTDEMKKAIAEAQKPDNKIMDERADIQKKNRGCD
jgi:hypothetical protein